MGIRGGKLGLDFDNQVNPGVKTFSWFKPNGESKSRIDYWLVSDNFLTYVKQSQISKAPLSDHCFIDLILEPSVREIGNKGY